LNDAVDFLLGQHGITSEQLNVRLFETKKIVSVLAETI